MATITEFGVTLKTLQEYISEIRQKYLTIDPAWNIEPESPDGLVIAVWSEMLANLDEALVQAYQSVDPNSATGQQLNRIAAFSGVSRRSATHSTTTATFTGNNLIEIPAGTKIRHRISGDIWRTDHSVVTSTSGKASVSVTCETPGDKSANAGTLTIIATPVGGVISVINNDAASVGNDEEKDAAFRVRRNEEVAKPGSNQVDNMHSAISSLSGVKQVKIYENDTPYTDANGLDKNSMAIFVDGGDPEEIAKSIAIKKNPGCSLNRNTNIANKIVIETTTPKGQPFTATFFRPEYITIYIRIEIGNRPLSLSDIAQIKEYVMNYVQLGFGETTGFAKTGFKIGENVVSGRIYTPVNYILGGTGEVNNIYLGVNATDINAFKVTVLFNQLAVFDINNIEVVNV